MTLRDLIPVAVGGLMGVMLYLMFSNMVDGASEEVARAIVLFAFLHLLVIAVLIGLAIFGITRFAKAQAVLSKMHRPSWRHAAFLIGSAVSAAGLVHLIFGGV
jgi:uncharacterized PurR-regulated membrane protein YhhQ (DUF165 family)